MSDREADQSQPKTALYADKDNDVVLRPHVYDGIQEYDQKLPNWWLFTFYGAVVLFVVAWIGYYQFDMGRTDEQEIEGIVAEIKAKKEAELEDLLKNLDDKSFVTAWATNEVAVANGQETFTTHCVACHGTDLSATMTVAGMPAPIPLPGIPLNDGEWKFGGNPMAVFKMINEGSPPESQGHNGAKMEVWGNKLPAKTIAEVTAYIISRNKEEFAKYGE
jgi:cytochrome c oxidase cbb3-type subunit 3